MISSEPQMMCGTGAALGYLMLYIGAISVGMLLGYEFGRDYKYPQAGAGLGFLAGLTAPFYVIDPKLGLSYGALLVLITAGIMLWLKLSRKHRRSG